MAVKFMVLGTWRDRNSNMHRREIEELGVRLYNTRGRLEFYSQKDTTYLGFKYHINKHKTKILRTPFFDPPQ